MSGSSHTLTPVTSAGINITATLTSKESLSVSSGVGGQPELKNRLPFNTSGDSQTQSSEGAKPSNPASGSGSSLFSSLGNLLAITGSFLVESITNSVDAEVGADAVLKSSGNITVSSAITEENQTGDNSTISRPEDSQAATLTVAVSMLVDSLNNTSTALIDGGARVDAGGALSVTSNVTYPWVGQINNPTGFDAATMFGSDLSANILKFCDATLGFESALVNNWADAAATASEQPADIAGSVNWTNYTNESEALIKAGALINQDAQYQDPAQAVSVNATTTFEAVNFAGNTSFDFLPADLVAAYKQTENAGWGGVANTVLGANAGATEGVGASLIVAVMNNTTLAMVGGPGTQLNFGNGGFSVTADQEVVQVNIGTSGGLGSSGLGAGGNYGANGTFSNFNADTNTSAQVASGTVVTGDKGTDGAVNVNADDTVLLIAVAGAAFKGENLGIGTSGVLNDVTRTTQAIIGTNLDDATPGSSTWKVAGPVTVSATEDGDVVNFALSGSVSTPSTGGPSGSEAAALPSSFGSWGIGISGDASYTDETDTTLAYINDAGTFSTGAMDVSADDKTVLAGFTGSYATASLSDAADQGAGTSTGIAGSYSEVDLGGSDEAFIQDAQLTVDGALSVEAERDNYLGTLACSVAGSPVDSSWEVAGSASLSFFSGDTEAYLLGVSGSVDSALTVTAEDDTIYVAIGGPVTSAGSGGLGLSFGCISVEHTLEAYAEDTTLTVGGDVEVEATADTSIGSLGLALGFSPGSSNFNGAGNCAVNTVEMTLEAFIGDKSDIVSSGAVTIEAQDNSHLVSASGGLAIASQSTVAVGAAASYNLINNTITADIDDSIVHANGGALTVSALSSPMLIALAAGGAGADQVGIAGSITVNSVVNTVSAYIADSSDVSSSGDLAVLASESALMVGVAGAIGVAGEAVGAAIAYNYVGQTFDTANPDEADHAEPPGSWCAAYIDDSTVSVGGNLKVSAGYQPPTTLPGTTTATINGDTGFGTSLSIPVSVDTQLVSVAVGGAGASGFALGASLTLSFIRQTIQASISDNSTVTVTGSVTVTAIDDSSIGNGAGAVSISTGAAAIGAAVASNDIADNLTADIANSKVTSSVSSISVVTQEEATITAVAVGGAGAGNFALGGSVVVSVIDNTIDAGITGSTVSADTGVTVSGSDTSTINVGAGQVSIATSGSAVGSASATNVITNDRRV